MNNSARDDHDNGNEVDPTGVRALLSGLPEPGPMPDDVMARITASLQAEQRRREEHLGAAEHGHGGPGAAAPAAFAQHQSATPLPGEGAPSDAASGDGAVLDFAAERRRRRGRRVTAALLTGAAAVAVGAAVVTSQLWEPGVPDLITADGQPAGDADPDTGSMEQDQAIPEADPAPGDPDDGDPDDGAAAGNGDVWAEEDPAGEQEFGLTDDAEGPRLAFSSELVELTSLGLTEEITAWYVAGPALLSASRVDSTVFIDTWDCVIALDFDGADTADFIVAPAQLDRQDALLVLDSASDPVLAWVLPEDCATGAADPVAGPITLATD